MPRLNEMVTFQDTDEDVVRAWGEAFIDLLHRTLVMDPRDTNIKLCCGPERYRPSALSATWLTLRTASDLREVIIARGSIVMVKIEFGELTLFIDSAHGCACGQSTVRQVTL